MSEKHLCGSLSSHSRTGKHSHALLVTAYQFPRWNLARCFIYDLSGDFKGAVHTAGEFLNPSNGSEGDEQKQERIFSQILTTCLSQKPNQQSVHEAFLMFAE